MAELDADARTRAIRKYCALFGLTPPIPGQPLPTFARTVQTCRSFPSQWNAWGADGQYYYLRYRSGRGTIECAASEDAYRERGPSRLVAAFFVDDEEYVGEMSLEEFLRLAATDG